MNILEIAKLELKQQAESIQNASQRLDINFEKAVDLIFKCRGKIIVTGMGKTGLIGRKIAATLSSTGTTAIFLHAAEGIHGDLGMIDKEDVIIAISYSGNTSELVSLIPYFKLQKNKIIALTGNKSSKLAISADIVLDCEVPSDYEHFGLVPTASTTVTLAIGDALAVALMKKRNFQISDYAILHPGGTIGKKILLTARDLMHEKEANPKVYITDSIQDVLIEMTNKKLGCTSVVDENEKLIGIFTDGDLRRLLQCEKPFFEFSIEEAMTKNPKRITPNELAINALNLMESHKITMLPVVDEKGKSIGLLHMHDLIDAGIV